MVSAILGFIKGNWISLTCGVAAAAGVAVAVLGLLDDSVEAAMQERVQKAGEISRLRSSPQNADTIEAEQRRTKEFEEKYAEALDYVAEKNQREPILAGVFPTPRDDTLRLEFKEKYTTELYKLPRMLNAGDRPSLREMRNEAEILEDIARRKAEREAEAGAPLIAAPPIPTGRAAAAGGGGRMAPGGGRAAPGRGGRMAPGAGRAAPTGRAPTPAVGAPLPDAGMQGAAPRPAQEVQVTPEAELRAAVRKARGVPMYATMNEQAPSFHVSPIIASPQAPSERQMWYAQLSLWIQQDIVSAIRVVNDAAAQRLPEGDASVANMPIKHLLDLCINGYINRAGVLVPFPTLVQPSFDESSSAGEISFTQRRSDEQFDVLQFTLTAIVDQRDLTALVDAITRENFYQLIDLDFRSVPPDAERADGYYYGGEPIVEATLTFEGYLTHKVFKEMMPKAVLQDLGAVEGAPPQ